MAFDGVAKVYYPDENCRFASYIIRTLEAALDIKAKSPDYEALFVDPLSVIGT